MQVASARAPRGQALLEYMLLLMITIAIAAIVLKTLVKKDPQDPGALINKWQAIVNQIGADDPNKTGK